MHWKIASIVVYKYSTYLYINTNMHNPYVHACNIYIHNVIHAYRDVAIIETR